MICDDPIADPTDVPTPGTGEITAGNRGPYIVTMATATTPGKGIPSAIVSTEFGVQGIEWEPGPDDTRGEP